MRITWPTVITLLRIGIIPVIVWLIITKQWLLAGTLLAFAMLTDFLDGLIARRFHLTTKVGALLDALADKALMLSLFLTFLIVPTYLPSWFVWLVLIKEFIVLCAAFILLQRHYVIVIAPLFLEKITMAAEMFLLLGMFFAMQFGLSFPVMLVEAVAGLIMITLLAYSIMVWRLKRKHEV